MKTQQEIEILIEKFKAAKDIAIKEMDMDMYQDCSTVIYILTYIISNEGGKMQELIEFLDKATLEELRAAHEPKKEAH